MLRICHPLRVPDVKSIYSMTGKSLTATFKQAAKEKASSGKLWDALMYRTSIVRSDLSVNDISVILNALSVFPKYTSPMFVRYLLEPLGSGNIKQVSLADLSMILRNSMKLSVFHSEKSKNDFFSSISPLICDKLTNSIRINDLANLISALRLYPLDMTLSQRIEAIIANLEIEKLNDPRSVIVFLDFILRPSQPSSSPKVYDDESEPFFSPTGRKLNEKNPVIISRLFNRSIALSSRFNHKDTLAFAACVEDMDQELLSQLGHPSVQPIARIIARLVQRDASKFKPSELVRLMQMTVLPEKSAIAKECMYRMRDFRCPNAIQILVHGPADAELASAVLARLAKFDALSTLQVEDFHSLASRLVSLKNQGIESPLTQPVLLSLIPLLRKADQSAVVLEVTTLVTQLNVADEPTIHKLITRPDRRDRTHR